MAAGKVSGAGPVPEGVADELAERDRSPLPAGAVVRFQAIAHGPDHRADVRWVLHDDGAVRLAARRARLPTSASGAVEMETVREIQDLLAREQFAALAPYQWRAGEGGALFIVTARVDGAVHEVVYDRAATPLTDRLQRVPGELEDEGDE